MSLYKSESEFLQALQTRQSDALAYLYDLYSKPMYSLALRILRDSQEAEDLIQEIFVGLWRNCNFDAQRGSLKTYLFLLVRSRALDRLRSHKAAQNLVLYCQELSTETPRPMDTVLTGEEIQQVRNAIATLPESQRQAIELAYYHGMTQTEISQHLNVPLGTVKSWFRLGFNKLRAVLKQEI